ncbi:carbohydrate sulfotransferase 1-like [Ptychodera flava]|uniref:carbohydrate sulfotransferase 1-like n=1 Tax=Ptychodera flava TaxID=63121 RepID=UPI003969C0CF
MFSKLNKKGFGKLAVMATLIMGFVLLVWYGRNSMKTYEHRYFSKYKNVPERVSVPPPSRGSVQQLTKTRTTEENYQNDSRVHIIIIARMSTGSTALGSMLGSGENSFYAYEPGLLFLEFLYHKNVFVDRASYLQEMQPQLCTFLGDLFKCNFPSDAYLRGLNNKSSLYRDSGHSLTRLSYPVSREELTSFCRSKSNIISKVLRFVDIESCLPTLKENKVKLIFLARDPRGMIASRLRRWKPFLRSLADVSNANYYPTEAIVKEHCDWLDMVYNLLKNGSKWLRENSMLVRFEDLCLYPNIVGQAIYNFVGLTHSEGDVGKNHNMSATRWLNFKSYANLKEIQDSCPRHVYDDFGWRWINSEEEFERVKTSSSWYYNELPPGRVALKYKIPKIFDNA